MALTVTSEQPPVAFLASPKLIEALNLPTNERAIVMKNTLDGDFPNNITLGKLIIKYKVPYFEDILNKIKKAIKRDKPNVKEVMLAISGLGPLEGVPSDLIIPLQNGATFLHNISTSSKDLSVRVRVIEVIRPFGPDQPANSNFNYIIGYKEILTSYTGSSSFSDPMIATSSETYFQMPLDEFSTQVSVKSYSYNPPAEFKKWELQAMKISVPVGSYVLASTQKQTLSQEALVGQTMTSSTVEHYVKPEKPGPNTFYGRVLGFNVSSKDVLAEILITDGVLSGQKIIRNFSEIKPATPSLPEKVLKELTQYIVDIYSLKCLEFIVLPEWAKFESKTIFTLGYQQIDLGAISAYFKDYLTPDKFKIYDELVKKTIPSHVLIKKGEAEADEAPYIWIVHDNDPSTLSKLPTSQYKYICSFAPEASQCAFNIDFKPISSKLKLSTFDNIWQPALKKILRDNNITDNGFEKAEDSLYLNNLISVKYALSVFENPQYTEKKINRLKSKLTEIRSIHQYNKILVEKWLGPSN